MLWVALRGSNVCAGVDTRGGKLPLPTSQNAAFFGYLNFQRAKDISVLNDVAISIFSKKMNKALYRMSGSVSNGFFLARIKSLMSIGGVHIGASWYEIQSQ